MKTKMIKSFSLVLTLVMLLSAIPFTANAADTIALKASNVTVWPTAIGEMYVGQTIGEHITLTGGEVQYNGVVVPGHFEHIDPEYVITSSDGTDDAWAADIKFVPDDTTTYKGFSKSYSKTTFPVYKTTPVFVDENDTVPVATEVEAGATLSTSTLSGAKMTNPYNADEPGIKSKGKWVWNDNNSHNVIINESGYHLARFICSGYETVKVWVLVRVKGDTSEVKIATQISEMPVIEGTYSVGDMWADIKLVGGKAVDMDGNTVNGTFSLDVPSGAITTGGGKTAYVVFTPDDSKYATAKSTNYLQITVSATPVRFVDKSGNEIIPTVEFGYNTKDLQRNINEIENLLAPYANCGADKFYCNWKDLDNKDLPHADDNLEINTTKEYTIRGLSYDSDNYAPAMLTFKLKVVPRKLTATVRYTGNAISVDTTKPLTDKLYGTFEYYANGEKVGTSQITTTTDATGFQWKPEASGIYDITVKFVPDEKDVYYFDDATVEDMEIICSWGVTVVNGTVKVSNSYKENGSFRYGEDVSVQSKNNAAFSHWIVTDTKGNEIDIEGFDKNASYNTFKMPDKSVNFKAVDLTQRNINCVNCFVKNAVGTADTPIRYKGQKVSIGIDEAALPLEKFAGWEITDSNGNAYLPEGMTEEALMNTNLEFTMPDYDITVKAKNVDDEKGDGFFAKVKAFFENLFNGETSCPVLNWLKRAFDIIVAFFTGVVNGLIK